MTNQQEINHTQIKTAIAHGRHMRSQAFHKTLRGLREVVFGIFEREDETVLTPSVKKC